MDASAFLPLNRAEMLARGWDRPDFVYVSGDAYVDHPSFGAAIISRVLEDAGFRVAILAQPDYRSCDAFREFGKPRLGFLVSAGNIDSMVAHYTAAKRRRSFDYYTPGGQTGKRPDRALIVYSNRIREAYGDIPIILGGLEASLRRFAHYDYWDDRVRRSVLVDSRADILTYGMGEKILVRLAKLLDKGIPVRKIHDVRGTVYLTTPNDPVHYEVAATFDYNDLKNDRRKYAEAFGIQYKNQDAINGRAICELYDGKMLVQNPPMPPLEREELDHVYSLPYTRNYHPSYEPLGGVPGIEEVKFSLTHNRGCFGGCNFCALAFHQGRTVRSRSLESVVDEAKKITALPDFKGYIHDIGGPTANFREPACEHQLTHGVCSNRKCLAPTPCKNLRVDHSEYLRLIEAVEALPKVKKVFIRSGIRFDYLLLDPDESFFCKLVRDNVSGQLKVAPEHCSNAVLSCMGKPDFSVYERFRKRFFELTKKVGKEQYLVPYLMSSHPGSTLADAIELALYLKRNGYAPEQVQDFYPTPGTASTVMYYTGINPLTMKHVYVATDYHEKQLQRALLQYNRPQNADFVREALILAGREDLIGFSSDCLVHPAGKQSSQNKKGGNERFPVKASKQTKQTKQTKQIKRSKQTKRAQKEIQKGVQKTTRTDRISVRRSEPSKKSVGARQAKKKTHS
ncbi:MAG: YgiQ family radical SAM protein [Ruminococcaceae bacterium]|nr:YgiQ family radical SAM protein [Oscillospiraceae bacterium]